MFTRSFLMLVCLAILSSAGAAIGQSDAGLVGYWKFDETSGTTAMESSGNGPDIEMVDTTWEEGISDGAVHFHGVGYGRDTSFSFTDSAITLSAWVWHDAFAGGQVERYLTVGPEIAVIRRNSDGRLHFYITTGGAFSHIYVGDVLTEGEWRHVAGTWDGDTQTLYLDGEVIGTATPSGALGTGTMVRLSSPDGEPLNGLLDEVRIYNRAFSQDEILTLMDVLALAEASEPVPAHEATDVPQDVPLSWTPGEYAARHDVYFGASFNDVNDASRSNPMGVLVSEGQVAAVYTPADVLDFGTTYYWRVDEVNAAPDNTIFKGDVWSFTAEPFAYPVAGVVATSNAASEAGAGPENTVNGSGINEMDQHSTTSSDMWLGVAGADPVTIQYEFDRVYKMHQMLVWNYNVQFELVLGFGLKDVTVEYSENGTDWTMLGDVDFAQATAQSNYTANTTVDFQGAAARFVKLTVNSGHGVLAQYGLSEVRFLYIPANAREPQPADGQTNVVVDTSLTWRAGREAVTHELSLGTDPEALSVVDTLDQAVYTPAALNLGTTYYWKVNEVNEADAVATWPGSVWSFATEEYLVVDDFESYDDEENPIFETWIDGLTNDTGSVVGYFDAPFAEQTIVHGGGQCMPLEYNNAGVATSEADFDVGGQDWSVNGIASLTLYFYGDVTNTTAQLYVKIDGTRIDYDGPAINITRPSWQTWSIDLAGAGNVSNVSSLTIGIEGAGAAGLVFIDDIRLYPEVLDVSSADITGAGDTVQGVPNDDDWPAAETPDLAIDDDTGTKFLHFKGATEPTGIQITPLAGASTVTGITFTTANDAAERDPTSFELYGSNTSIDGPYALIASGDIVDFTQADPWPRFTKNETEIAFDNDVAYTHYQVLFPTVRDPGSANSMQIAEIELLGALVQ